MRESVSTKPAIFAMSNPTMNAECTAIDAFNHAGESIVFASGSPFENVDLGNGRVGHVNQANNMYLFPGIGLGSLLSGARHITDGMLQAASECLASYMTEEDIKKGILYPCIDSIRNVTAHYSHYSPFMCCILGLILILYQGTVNQTRLKTVHCKIDHISYFMIYIYMVLMPILTWFYSYSAASANSMFALAAL
ncbi:unnamed protein product [Trifolium pratense]|uniref:Uncharacterized protein n=1 Tax=Trifolium pratense TaxID=57577 RepID=A0ACB0KZD8_TRIPR|nr:unnamed protein product [Trifolium pratense]